MRLRVLVAGVLLSIGTVATLGGVACNSEPTPSPDAGPDRCAVVCDAASSACGVDGDACRAACAASSIDGPDGSVPRDVRGCLEQATGDGGPRCSAVQACFRPTPTTAFAPGPYGTNPKDTAGPFVLPTTAGDWDFQSEWTGEDSYVFLFYAPNEVLYKSGDYSLALYKQSLANEVLAKSPTHVHYFFLPLRADAGWAAARDAWAAQAAAAGGEWAARVHFSDVPALEQTGWIGDMMRARAKAPGPYAQYDTVGFAIDRFQRIREVGMLGQLASSGITARLSFLTNEPRYYDFEWNRERALAAEASPTIVTLASAKTVYDVLDVDVTLPDAKTMAGFDTLEVDLAMDCDHHRDGECGAWDYTSKLWACAPSADAGADGGSPWQCDTEVARWITSYWRETRWVTDISGMLALLKDGGPRHFRWWASGQWDPRKTNYVVSLAFRLSNRGKGMRPTSATPLWTGAPWNAGYDGLHPPKPVAISSTAKKVDLYVLATGHGAEDGNCAEFCNHEHHFTVEGKEHLLSFPGAQTTLGCASEVGKGVVPNQHGTWYFGRGGWCPGYDVAPWIVDVTKEVTAGKTANLGYTTTFGGQPVATGRGYIELSSYLVTWE
jgi:hypothetical protein